jgi:REP element-mobilizing transposase RayT
MTLLARTTRFTWGRLPHWEIEGGRYFVTVRYRDSLPADVVERLREVNRSLQQTQAASPAFAQLQRQYFLTMEKFLDRGTGEAPLRHAAAADALAACFANLAGNAVFVTHYTIMPNHWHALIELGNGGSHDLHATMTRLKGASARAVNVAIGRSGTLWQREWFDRWMRSEAEWQKCRDYIRANPVKAGIVKDWRDHAWTK